MNTPFPPYRKLTVSPVSMNDGKPLLTCEQLEREASIRDVAEFLADELNASEAHLLIHHIRIKQIANANKFDPNYTGGQDSREAYEG